MNILSSDKPITDPKIDRLGYAPFAKHLAESIHKMIPTEGLVIAIHGPWGSGKTTLLNFVVHYLQQKPEGQQPIIVQFNPWWFSGSEDLTRRFFDQLQAILGKRKVLEEKLRKKISDFAELVSEIPLPYPYAPTSKAVAKLTKVKQKNLFDLKNSIAKDLRKQKRRILVIIDDIDRLIADEIRQLFCVIKAIADFPNVVYLLAFDKEVVIKALTGIQGTSGEDYLEKIVQAPFELPLPDKTSLRRVLFEKLDVILVDSPVELFDPTYWGNVYLEGIDHFITTPRDIVRLTNALTVTYSAVRGEVNPVDFIAIETLRIFCPLVYDKIRKNPGMFTGHTDIPNLHSRNIEELSFHNSWMEKVHEEDREPIKRLLIRIFPKLGAVWGNGRYGSDWESTWRNQLRVCSSDIFPIYFRLTIPEGGISNSEMRTILTSASDEKAFAARLIELANQKRPDGTTRVRIFLERFEDYTENEIHLDWIPSIIKALFDVGDYLLRPEDERRGISDFGNNIRIGRIIWQLLRRLDEPTRFEVLKEAMANGKAVATIEGQLTVLGQQHGMYEANQPRPEEERLINIQHLNELKEIALMKVRDAAQQNSLIQAPELPHVLRRWRDWSSEEEVKQWIQRIISDDSGLIMLLEKFLQKTYSQLLSDTVGKMVYRLDPQWLEPFLDTSQIIDRVKGLIKHKGLTENQRIAINQFVREYEIRQQGKDPSNPLAWV